MTQALVITETRRLFVKDTSELREKLFDLAEQGWHPFGHTPDTVDIWFYWHWQDYLDAGGWIKLYRKTHTC